MLPYIEYMEPMGLLLISHHDSIMTFRGAFLNIDPWHQTPIEPALPRASVRREDLRRQGNGGEMLFKTGFKE